MWRTTAILFSGRVSKDNLTVTQMHLGNDSLSTKKHGSKIPLCLCAQLGFPGAVLRLGLCSGYSVGI